MHADQDSPLTAGELDEALHALKCGKAGGENGLPCPQVWQGRWRERSAMSSSVARQVERMVCHVLKCGKAGGENGLVSEQVKRVGVAFKEYIL